MSRFYYSLKEEECYREGRRDAEYGRGTWDHCEYSGRACDRAYFEGREDYRREERRREEEREIEHQEELRQERLAYERRLQEQYEIEEYYRALDEQAQYYRQQEDEYWEEQARLDAEQQKEGEGII